ncbi:MAG: hypothetical protein HGA47_10185 [Zoogloea sp.]|nr:hypothetical protein [Zoogloea sp.]
MDPELLEIALRKQRLQLKAEAQREDLASRLEAFGPILATFDRVGEGVDWAKRHAPIVATVSAVLLAIRPRATVRWLRRGWAGWKLFRRLKSSLAA